MRHLREGNINFPALLCATHNETNHRAQFFCRGKVVTQTIGKVPCPGPGIASISIVFYQTCLNRYRFAIFGVILDDGKGLVQAPLVQDFDGANVFNQGQERGLRSGLDRFDHNPMPQPMGHMLERESGHRPGKVLLDTVDIKGSVICFYWIFLVGACLSQFFF